MRFIVLLLALVATPAFADMAVQKSMTCVKGKTTRGVELKLTDGNKPPCVVAVNGKVKWSAKNTTRYCESKYLDHKQKLEKMGYKCE